MGNAAIRRVRAWVVACLALVGLIVVPAAPAAAADCVDPGTAYPPVPWPQRMYDFERVWPLTRGAGVRVAVIDSGVDAGHPQLQGHVAAGTDFITPGGNGQGDCSGRGTQTAGIIVAQPQQNVGFHGVAPQATIVPIRVSDQSNGQSAGVAGIANGIRFAVNSGAKVILVSQASYFTDTNLANAVEGALAADVLVVAAVGEDGVKNGGNRTPYPAALPGVIGVAAIEESTLASENSGRGTFVDLVAPGVQVATTQRGGGLTLVEGSAYAAAFVAGTAALVRGWWPRMTVAEVVQRLIATASPAPGGRDSQTYGYGIVDPYSALADQLTDAEPAALPGMGQEDASDVARERSWTSSGNLAKLLAGIGVLVALALVGLGAAVPRGRRRRWRPSIARQPVQRPEDDEPTPPVQLFADRETAPGA